MENLILKGPGLNVPRIDKGVGEYFFEKAELHGDKIFQINGEDGCTETFRTAKLRTTRIAINLQKMGIKPKDVVMICCRNNPNNIIPALASFYLGVYVSPIDPMQTILDIRNALTLVKPKIIFVEENSLSLIEKSLESFDIIPEIIVMGNSKKYKSMGDMERETEEEKNFQPIKQKGSDIVGILFSSGTTSAPKGIQLSNSYVLNIAQAIFQHKHSIPGVFLHFASLYWVSAWITIGTVVSTGSVKLSVSHVTAERFLQLVEKYKVSYLFSSASFTYEITDLPEEVIKKYDTSSLHNICIAGSIIDPQQLLKIRKLLPHTYVALGYGSTEGGCLVAHGFANQKAYEEKILSSGTVVPEMQLKIVDLETNKLLEPNQEGEIRVKSPFLMSGYHNFENPDTFDEDGFFKTGDCGYYDEDKYIYITDRIGEMFKYKVNQISPSVIEQILLTHPAVGAAVVFGVPHPVDRNHPGACIVLKKGSDTTVEELLDFVNSKVSDSRRLRAGLMIVDSFPKTPTGKIQRRSIRDLFIKTNDNN